ncbi:hypothetical protein [Noviherbaspirillum malthae]|uniref:hypothetical protein n=1 Tax=Noviherbaspirillum malthae TaxID=1260987 RepID=UPI00188F3981|nr:hypothetical protein [Noviherbaspirillum malthae]
MDKLNTFLVDLWLQYRQAQLGRPALSTAIHLLHTFDRLHAAAEEPARDIGSCSLAALIDEAIATAATTSPLTLEQTETLRRAMLACWGDMYALVKQQRQKSAEWKRYRGPEEPERPFTDLRSIYDLDYLVDRFNLRRVISLAVKHRWNARDLAAYLDDRYAGEAVCNSAATVNPPSGLHFDSSLAALYAWLGNDPYMPAPFTGDCLLGYSVARLDSPTVYLRFVHDRNDLCRRRRLDDGALLSPPGAAWRYKDNKWRKGSNVFKPD